MPADPGRAASPDQSSVPVAVVVACAEPFLCEALNTALTSRPPLEVVGRTTDELAAAAAVEEFRPQVVLAGRELATGSGLSLARRLRDACRTVLLTRRHEGDILFDAVEAGAMGCVHHDVGLDELVPLIRQAAEGTFALAPSRLHEVLKRALARSRRQAAGASRLEGLTAREREVLALVASGSDNVVIARRLYLSPQTVRTHVGNILKKLRVHSRAEAARVGLEAGLGDSAAAAVLHLEGPELGNR
jgi:DNA-binding NarL/FixJ family response regulator